MSLGPTKHGKVAVFTAGSWGTAFSIVLADAGNEVVLWARREELARAINEQHENPDYQPGVELPATVSATADVEKALHGADLVVLATRFGAGELLEVEWNAARAVLLERIAAAEATSTLRPADVPDVKDLHAAWRRGELGIRDKQRVLVAVVERITINRGVRGRSFIGNRPEDRVVITWRSTVCTAADPPER